MQPLPVPAVVAIVTLLLAVVTLWLRPAWLWIAAAAAAIVAASIAGLLDGPAPLGFVLLAYALARVQGRHGVERAAYVAVVVVASLILALHLAPGVHNPVVIDGVLSTGATRYTQYANVDKGLAGVVLLGVLGLGRLPDGLTARAASMRAALVAVTTITVVMAGSLALGFVRFEPRWTPLFWTWAPINLLLTCVAEEAFFRGFVQREVERLTAGRPCGAAFAVAASALLFGLAHAAGGWRYVLLSTVAGVGYALAWQRTGRIEAPILTHFAVNATHFLLFTYPALG